MPLGICTESISAFLACHTEKIFHTQQPNSGEALAFCRSKARQKEEDEEEVV